jgi:PAT family beta-lactamase induction signal transducer AmpG
MFELPKKMLVMLCLGFSSGLPYIVLITTSSAWFKDVGVSLTLIGFFAWITFPYTIKFLWAPLVDRFEIIAFKKFGHRKSWILLTQLIILVSIFFLSLLNPQIDLKSFYIVASIIAIAGSFQDIAIDAFRIEYAKINDQGNLAAAYQLGYRFAIITAASFGLIFADLYGWSLTFKLLSIAMLVGVLGVIFSEEVRNEELGRLTFVNSIIEPLLDFFTRFKWYIASILLLIIATYRLTDIVMGPMATPFYLEMGFSLTEIGSVVKVAALIFSIVGVFLGGIFIKKIGVYASLIIGAFLVFITNLFFSYVSISEKSLFLLTFIVSLDSLAVGIVGTVNIAFLTSLVSKKYTAFQYALLTGFMAGPGFILKGLSGAWVEKLQNLHGLEYGWMYFYIFTSLLTLPVIFLLLTNRGFFKRYEKSFMD